MDNKTLAESIKREMKSVAALIAEEKDATDDALDEAIRKGVPMEERQQILFNREGVVAKVETKYKALERELAKVTS